MLQFLFVTCHHYTQSGHIIFLTTNAIQSDAHQHAFLKPKFSVQLREYDVVFRHFFFPLLAFKGNL